MFVSFIKKRETNSSNNFAYIMNSEAPDTFMYFHVSSLYLYCVLVEYNIHSGDSNTSQLMTTKLWNANVRNTCNSCIFYVVLFLIGAVLRKRKMTRVRQLIADHPFIFTIHRKADVLFMGRAQNL